MAISAMSSEVREFMALSIGRQTIALLAYPARLRPSGRAGIIEIERISMAILKLKRHNEKKEIEFELRYLKSLSVKQRFELMVNKTKEIVNLLEKSGHRRAFAIIKRT